MAYWDRFNIVGIEANVQTHFGSGDALTTPAEYKHPELVPPEYHDTYFKGNDDYPIAVGSGRGAGIKLMLLSMAGFGIGFNGVFNWRHTFSDGMPLDEDPRTLWGRYGYGNYAFIGGTATKQSNSLLLTVEGRTPPIPLSDALSLQFFYSYNWGNELTINYKSGYHEYDVPYRRIVDNIEVVRGKIASHRFGPMLRFEVDDPDDPFHGYFSISLFGQINTLNFERKETTKGFAVDGTSFSVGVDLTFGLDLIRTIRHKKK